MLLGVACSSESSEKFMGKGYSLIISISSSTRGEGVPISPFLNPLSDLTMELFSSLILSAKVPQNFSAVNLAGVTIESFEGVTI